MKKTILCLLVLAVAMTFGMSSVEAKYGLVKWYLGVFDEDGQLVTDTTTVNVYTAGTVTNATIYSDENATAKSNSWNITDGKIVFYSSATTLDIQANSGARGARITTVTSSSTHRITLPMEPVGIQKSIFFTPGDFTMVDNSNVNTVGQITASTTPGLEYDNKGLSIVWSDGEETPVEVKFRVPYDYLSGGSFRGFFDCSNATGASVDYQVFVNKDLVAWDTTATNQTPVFVDGNGSPEEKTLAITTDFASLAAGNLVTFQCWRNDGTAGETADLELYYLEFYYNAKQ